ncbi:MAG: hypothetical protein ACFHU9_11975 [Fluviicola sp.]
MTDSTRPNDGNEPSKSWLSYIPWFLTIASTFALIAIGLFLISNINWYKTSVFDPKITDVNSGAYRVRAYDLHLSMIKRSVGLFSGFALMFIGMGVSFFTMRKNTEMQVRSTNLTASLVTASPGIIAVLVGGYLIISTIRSKDSFGSYDSIMDTETLEKQQKADEHKFNPQGKGTQEEKEKEAKPSKDPGAFVFGKDEQPAKSETTQN